MLKTCCGLDLDVGAFLIASFQLLCSIIGLIFTVISKTSHNHTNDTIFEKEQNLFIGFFILNIIANGLVFTSLRTKKSSPLILWLFFGLAPCAYLFAALVTNLSVEHIRWPNTEIALAVIFCVFQIYVWFVMLSLYRSFERMESPLATSGMTRIRPANSYAINRSRIVRLANLSASYPTECINSRDRNDFDITINALDHCLNEANEEPENFGTQDIGVDCCESNNCGSGADIGSCGDYAASDGDYGGCDGCGGDNGGECSNVE